MGSTQHMLASLGPQSWQHITVRDLHKHCVAAEVIASRKPFLTPSVQLRPSDPILHFKLHRRLFLPKSRLLSQSVRPKGRHLTVLLYIHRRLFFPIASSTWHLADLHLIWSLLQILTDINICDVTHCIRRSAIKLLKYKHIFVDIKILLFLGKNYLHRYKQCIAIHLKYYEAHQSFPLQCKRL